MPEKATVKRAQQDKRAGKSASTQAGEFVREEMEHIREGKHGAKNAKQAIAIGLSKARQAGVALKDKSESRPSRKSSSKKKSSAKPSRATRSTGSRKSTGGRKATGASRASGRKSSGSAGRIRMPKVSAKRSAAATKALKGKPRRAASHLALSRQAHRAANQRTKADRSAAARKGARTRARAGR